ncbi:MAG: GNAT family N-acetyltransferase [Oscillibacter sp.]|jgi:ribosomal protein S18 acetylase RimI-like enzyme|nr:GNAT family N-acetyltransferase [Oscillibacter sp.]
MEENAALLGQKYLECFCRRSRDGFFVRYADPALPDMYCHNFLELKKPVGTLLLRKTLEERIAAARAAGAAFFRLELGIEPASLPGAFPQGGEPEHNGLYRLAPERAAVERWASPPECAIRPMADSADTAALAEIELSNADGCGRGFCLRRAERRARVYTSGGPCRNFLADWNGQAAGTCVLFTYGGMGRLEDLVVRPELRRRKIASSLLRTLVLRGMDDGCRVFFLTADEDDTPKALYRALGFEKTVDTWALTWRL